MNCAAISPISCLVWTFPSLSIPFQLATTLSCMRKQTMYQRLCLGISKCAEIVREHGARLGGVLSENPPVFSLKWMWRAWMLMPALIADVMLLSLIDDDRWMSADGDGW